MRDIKELKRGISKVFKNIYYYRFYNFDHLPSNKYILCYHGLFDAGISNIYNLKNISFTNFKRQIFFLKKEFNFVSLADFYRANPKDKCISLTFDDGMLNNYTYLFNFIKQYDIPVTLFVTGYPLENISYVWNDFYDLIVGEYGEVFLYDQLYKNTDFIKEKFKRDANSDNLVELIQYFEEKYDISLMNSRLIHDFLLCMNSDQIKKIAELPNVEIGSHGYWHRKLAYLTTDDAIAELQKSKNYLESLLGKGINSLSYPFGSYRREIAEEAEKMGFRYQLLLSKYNEPSDAQLAFLKQRIGITDSKYPYLFLYSLIHMPKEP